MELRVGATVEVTVRVAVECRRAPRCAHEASTTSHVERGQRRIYIALSIPSISSLDHRAHTRKFVFVY